MRWASCSMAVGVSSSSGVLTVEDLVDALAQCGPLGLGNLEVAAEVEQGALADLRAGALAAHEAVGVVGLAVGMAGLGASDEHGGDGTGGGCRCQGILERLWHYICHSPPPAT